MAFKLRVVPFRCCAFVPIFEDFVSFDIFSQASEVPVDAREVEEKFWYQDISALVFLDNREAPVTFEKSSCIGIRKFNQIIQRLGEALLTIISEIYV